MAFKVYVTRQIPEPGLELITKDCEMEINTEDRVLTREEIIRNVKGKDGLLCLLTDDIDEQIMDAEPNLKIISNYAVGYNNIDVEAATKRGIIVTNTPGVLTDTTADLAWALLMSVARRIVEGDKFTRSRKFKGWGPMLLLGTDVYGKTLGIIGLGRIGRAMAKRARGFDMEVIYYDLYRADESTERKLNVRYVPFEELLKQADFVSIHVPLSKETHHLFGKKEFEMMKKSAYLINSARGPIVDEKALVEALVNKEIAGAGLDVYENEPMVEEKLLELDNVVLIPHLGSATLETRTKMALMAAENLLAGLKGEKPPNIVNPEVLKSRI